MEATHQAKLSLLAEEYRKTDAQRNEELAKAGKKNARLEKDLEGRTCAWSLLENKILRKEQHLDEAFTHKCFVSLVWPGQPID